MTVQLNQHLPSCKSQLLSLKHSIPLIVQGWVLVQIKRDQLLQRALVDEYSVSKSV